MISNCKCGHSDRDHGVNVGAVPAFGAVDVSPVWCNPAGHLCQCRHFTGYIMPAAS